MARSIPAHFVATLNEFEGLLASGKLESAQNEVPIESWQDQVPTSILHRETKRRWNSGCVMVLPDSENELSLR